MADFIEDVPEAVKVEAVVEIGRPTEMIDKVAKEGRYDLIIMGSRGLGMLENLIIGGVSQHVLHHAKCPVLIAR